MRFAWWPHTSNSSVASYRLRCLRVVEELSRRGVDAALFRAGDVPDVLVLSKRYDAASLEAALGLRTRRGTRVVLDLCDNHFHSASDAPQWQRRGEALRDAARAADLVIASSDALERVVQAETQSAVQTVVIGDAAEAPDLDPPSRWRHPLAEHRLRRLRTRLARVPAAPGRRLVWFGNHGSDYAEGGMSDLCSIQAVLEAANRDSPLSLTVISNSRAKFADLTRSWRLATHYVDWHPATFSRALQCHDVALIPVRPNPFTLCKTNNRVATALLHGLGVAADSIPSYRALAEWVVLDNWHDGLHRLMSDADYRRACVARGGEMVRTQWSIERIGSQWLQALRRVAGAA